MRLPAARYDVETANIDHVRIEGLAERHIKGLHHAIDLVSQERVFLGMTSAPEFDCFSQEVQNSITKNWTQFVALRQEEVLGWCIVFQTDLPVLHHAGTLFMGVIQPWRGQGIGASLLAATLQQAWERHLTRIDLEVYAHNTAAIQLYRRFGFRVEGVKRYAHSLDGRYLDILSMAKIKRGFVKECE